VPVDCGMLAGDTFVHQYMEGDAVCARMKRLVMRIKKI
jgi:hypothetical protein